MLVDDERVRGGADLDGPDRSARANIRELPEFALALKPSGEALIEGLVI